MSSKSLASGIYSLIIIYILVRIVMLAQTMDKIDTRLDKLETQARQCPQQGVSCD